MEWFGEAPLPVVFRRRENQGEPVDDRRLRARLEAGEIIRIAAGSFAPRNAWQELSPRERHAQRVWEAAARARIPVVFSHFAAAALHGIDILGSWPSRVDVSIETASGGRSSGDIQRRSRDLAAVETMTWGRHSVTTALQTTIDLLRVLPFIEGVAVADQALWRRRAPGPLVGAGDLLRASDTTSGRGSARARRAAVAATGEADSVRESQSRVLIAELGFPEPELQSRFVLDDGRSAYTDFFWPGHRHIGEFDGEGKYRDPALLGGRTPHEALMAEKDREDQLRRQVRAFSRWRTADLTRPRRLYDILATSGLPTRRPRPGR